MTINKIGPEQESYPNQNKGAVTLFFVCFFAEGIDCVCSLFFERFVVVMKETGFPKSLFWKSFTEEFPPEFWERRLVKKNNPWEGRVSLEILLGIR